jgi:hypothetical protein
MYALALVESDMIPISGQCQARGNPVLPFLVCQPAEQ